MPGGALRRPQLLCPPGCALLGTIHYDVYVAQKDHEWFKRRRYSHFDSCLKAEDAELLVSDPARIAKHNFWPLVWYNEKSRVWKRSPKGRARLQPTSGPRPARRAQKKAIDTRVNQGRASQSGRWKIKRRPIAYASHRDAAIFSYYAFLLQKRFEHWLSERKLSDSVLAYRRVARTSDTGGKTNYDFAAEAFAEIVRRGKCEAVCLDLKSFFDTLSHKDIKHHWKRICGFEEMPPDHFAVFNAATRFSRVPLQTVLKTLGISVRAYKRMKKKSTPFRVDSETFRRSIREKGLIEANTGPRRRGIPQGLPISGLLANMAMLAIDARMQKMTARCQGSYRRYSDDVLIITPYGHGRRLEATMCKLVTDAGMSIQKAKTSFHVFRRDVWGRLCTAKPMQYLGFEFDGHRVTIRSQTLARFSKRMRRAIRTAGRIAGRRWDGVGSVRIRRRTIYNLYSPLPYLWRPTDRKKWRGDFTDYARHSRDVFDTVLADGIRAQMLKQLRHRMSRLEDLIARTEEKQTFLQNMLRAKPARI
jgi:RNA-directed DNA polymerase